MGESGCPPVLHSHFLSLPTQGEGGLTYPSDLPTPGTLGLDPVHPISGRSASLEAAEFTGPQRPLSGAARASGGAYQAESGTDGESSGGETEAHPGRVGEERGLRNG